MSEQSPLLPTTTTNGKMAPEGKSDVYKTVYTPSWLAKAYDLQVLGWNMRFAWGCPTASVLLPFFGEGMSRNHLDVGVATGYLPAKVLERVHRRDSPQRLCLVDITAPPLRMAEARVRSIATRITTECVEADVTDDALPEVLRVGEKFETITMFNLFHCIPGGMKHKLKALDTYKTLLTEDGTLTGCTVLGEGHATGWLSRWYVRRYNTLGYFHNLEDRREDIEAALRKNFEEVETWVVGLVLLFRARKPKN